MMFMKRKHQRALELIFARPVSGSLPWRAVVLPLCSSAKSGSFTDPILFQTQIRVLLLQSANGLRNTELLHEFDDR